MAVGRRGLLAMLGAVAAGGARAATPGHKAGPGDLTGTWTLGSFTDFERPKELKTLNLTPAEAEAYEAPRRALHGMPASEKGSVGQAEAEFIERGDGLARVYGQIRSSWIIDPPDGRVPFTKEARKRLGLDDAGPPSDDNPEDETAATRCVGNTAAGAPMVGAPDTNLFQVIQTPEAVVILTEKYHDARIVRLGPAAGGPPQPPSWLGDSVGHWEGATLVVRTTGFRAGELGRGRDVYRAPTTRVTERFTRAAQDALLYEFTVEDPALYTQPWRAQMMLRPAPGRIFEFACHEGNYSMAGILAGARAQEREAVAAKPGR